MDVAHDFRDALLFFQNVGGELGGRQVCDVFLGARVLPVEVEAACGGVSQSGRNMDNRQCACEAFFDFIRSNSFSAGSSVGSWGTSLPVKARARREGVIPPMRDAAVFSRASI